MEAFDRRMPELLGGLGLEAGGEPGAIGVREGSGVLLLTGDHGCDPTDVSTDHTREYVPALVAGTRGGESVDLGTRDTFADLGATVAELLGVPWGDRSGASFAPELGLTGPGGAV
jgi:phosphopentomutase